VALQWLAFFLRNFGLTGLSCFFLGQIFATWPHQKIKIEYLVIYSLFWLNFFPFEGEKSKK
jgi:hypothetical protein